jgi:F0F1-type ATP synthase gamma subunit
MHDGPRDLAGVEHRIRSIESVEKVMRAVWALARAQQPQVEAVAAESTAYLDAAEAMVTQLAGAPTTPEASEDVLWVLVGPERAFCGPLARVLLEQVPAVGSVGLVGQRLIAMAEQLPLLDARVVFRVPAAATPEDLGPRADVVASAVLSAPHHTVVVLTPEPEGTQLHRTTLLARDRHPVAEPPETFLSAAEVLEAAMLEAVAGRLAVALAEALRAEVRARLIASEAARKACDTQIGELRHEWRMLRQGAITEELVALTSGRKRGWQG